METPDPRSVTIVDVTDEATFALIPPCADPTFDHRSCDYWEDADRGSKAIRLDWLEPPATESDAATAAQGGQPVPRRSRGAIREPVRSAGRGGGASIRS